MTKQMQLDRSPFVYTTPPLHESYAGSFIAAGQVTFLLGGGVPGGRC